MYAKFPLFQGHLDFSRHYWQAVALPGDQVIDATCGNGHDTLTLCQLVLTKGSGKVYALDIQENAITETSKLLHAELDKELHQQVHIIQGCHSSFPKEIQPKSIKLIIYNLGYLPKGDKTKTTVTEITLKSLSAARELVTDGGLISITCYPGHDEGAREETAILDYALALDPQQWSCTHHRWLNRKKSPSLLLLQKSVSN